MTQKERVLVNSEAFVREMAAKMNHKALHEKTLKKVARKVSKSIPLTEHKHAASA